ncbi:reverse transcriptase [Senna tora]|uniref:Reverse transcriptase n=1 Tax=Senna tora TaxID=362788 RepID=A0A834TGU3_9FABA|nr:reverse transcriptase [Senna tora]
MQRAESLDEEPERKLYDYSSSSKYHLQGTKSECDRSGIDIMEQLSDSQNGNLVPSGVLTKRSPPKRSFNTGVLVTKVSQHFHRELDDASSSTHDHTLTSQTHSNNTDPMEPFHMFSWIARGVASGDFKRVFRDMIQRYKPNLVLVTETRVSGDKASEIINTLSFKKHFKVELMGYAGGLWLLWNEEQVRLTIQDHTF